MAEFYSVIGQLCVLCLVGLAFFRTVVRNEFSLMVWREKNSEYP